MAFLVDSGRSKSRCFNPHETQFKQRCNDVVMFRSPKKAVWWCHKCRFLFTNHGKSQHVADISCTLEKLNQLASSSWLICCAQRRLGLTSSHGLRHHPPIPSHRHLYPRKNGHMHLRSSPIDFTNEIQQIIYIYILYIQVYSIIYGSCLILPTKTWILRGFSNKHTDLTWFYPILQTTIVGCTECICRKGRLVQRVVLYHQIYWECWCSQLWCWPTHTKFYMLLPKKMWV